MRNRDLKTMTHDELRRKLDRARSDLRYFADRFDDLSWGECSRRQRERYEQLRDSARVCAGKIGD